jgi:hypothetical protein
VQKGGHLLQFIKIGFGNRPIADFFHDQTIFLKDCELYTIGHSLVSATYEMQD